MLKLVTQDGRTLQISRDLHLLAGAGHRYTMNGYTGSEVKAATFTKKIRTLSNGRTYDTGDELVERYGVIGTYSTKTGAENAADALNAAWKNGATKFTMPQDTGEKSDAEKLDDFAEANNLTLCSINEVGYKPADIAQNLQIWRTTDEFERRNIIIADEFGNYETSLAKWRAIQLGETA